MEFAAKDANRNADMFVTARHLEHIRFSTHLTLMWIHITQLAYLKISGFCKKKFICLQDISVKKTDWVLNKQYVVLNISVLKVYVNNLTFNFHVCSGRCSSWFGLRPWLPSASAFRTATTRPSRSPASRASSAPSELLASSGKTLIFYLN